MCIEKNGKPHYTKDGVTVAKQIYFDDPAINMGATSIKEAATNTCDSAGDGTTATCVLVQAMVERGIKYINKGYNPMEIRKGIMQAANAATTEIKKHSKAVVNDKKLIENIASVSANNDREIGSLIGKAYDKVTENGVIIVEESKGFKTELRLVDGLRFDSGYYSPHFINSLKEECVLKNPYIIISDKKIERWQSLIPVLEKVSGENRSLLIICDEMEVEPLATLVVNAQKGAFSSCVVKCPGFGDVRKEWLEDIATVTGGKYISDDQADKLSDLQISGLGQADKVVIKKYNTTIVNGKGKKEEIAERVKKIEEAIKDEDKPVRRRNLSTRLAKIIGGVAVLSIGGNSEIEVKEKADLIDDAISSTKSAFEEGIVPGGGIVFMRISEELKKLRGETKSIQKGIDVVRYALQQPFTVILENAGLEVNRSIKRFARHTEKNIGFDVMSECFVDMSYAGILDPAKVLRVSLENAASVAALMITTEASITDRPA